MDKSHEYQRTLDSQPKPRSASAKALRHAANSYLQRYPSSKGNLRRVLHQRLDRATHAYGSERQATPGEIDVILEELETAGLIDDARYAARMAESWHRRGESVRAIQARLSQKSVPSALIDETLNILKQSNPHADLQAAVSLVRRRRLGPLRAAAKAGQKREAYFKKDLGVLARAGFSYALARRVLEAEDDDALHDLLKDARAF